MNSEELIVQVRLKGRHLEIFKLILKEWTFTTNSEAVRFSIAEFWKLFKEREGKQ